ncbi:MAG: 2-oxoacid:acceptor oxidoreductase family protein [Candidatus Thorarchaeota archaeon]|jgi:pyruvate ferredoxin oxidoreductase gamma subunit
MAMDFAKGITEFRWHGRGGQGVVTSNQMLGKAALAEGNYIQAFPEFGPERTGAPVRAFLRISKEPIQVYAQVYAPDVVVCIDPTLLDVVNPAEGLKAEGTLVINTEGEPKSIRDKFGFNTGKVVTVDASTIAMEVMGRPFYNMPTMAAAVKATSVVDIDTVIGEVLERYPGKVGDLNKVAIERACEEAKVG